MIDIAWSAKNKKYQYRNNISINFGVLAFIACTLWSHSYSDVSVGVRLLLLDFGKVLFQRPIEVGGGRTFAD